MCVQSLNYVSNHHQRPAFYLTPRGELGPPGVKILSLPLHSSKHKWVFTRWGQVHPLGQTFYLVCLCCRCSCILRPSVWKTLNGQSVRFIMFLKDLFVDPNINLLPKWLGCIKKSLYVCMSSHSRQIQFLKTFLNTETEEKINLNSQSAPVHT
jgi:hypothetical protein